MMKSHGIDRLEPVIHRPLPSEVCKGALVHLIFEGQSTSESRIEMLLDRLERIGR